jgi:FKBP-type peptidyl-prolyl cis-trans isomerase 2
MAVKKNDFVEIDFTGYANGELFDSTKTDEVKKLSPKAEGKPLIIAIGQGMILPVFDKELEGKEIGKDYVASFTPEQSFGERRKDLVRMVPLNTFKDQRVQPQVGMTLALDRNLVKVLNVSGGRVTLDFNNPLAGKDIKYNYRINRLVTEEQLKITSLFESVFRFVPKFEIKDTIVITGPKFLEHYVKTFNPKFKELIGKELSFVEEKLDKKEEAKTETKA